MEEDRMAEQEIDERELRIQLARRASVGAADPHFAFCTLNS
jgi:hypothetical protein